MFKIYYSYIIFGLIILSGCSSPNNCPLLEYNSIEKLTRVDGELFTGRCITYKDDYKRSVQQYINGIDSGSWVFYYPNGEIETIGRFNNGNRVGKWKYYYPNGKIMQISQYSRTGERSGEWIVYDTIGKIIEKVKY